MTLPTAQQLPNVDSVGELAERNHGLRKAGLKE